jgi:hypothetical protein
MGRRLVQPFILILLSCFALPAAVIAQEATISGTVRDSTAAVLPGVAVRAVHEATGTQFEGFTDERGNFRIPVRIGGYHITAELAGFATLQQMGLEVLVGQQVSLNLVMMPSTISESVTVTGEAPLVNVTSSQLGGNIDSRQLSELPVNGRNFLDLTMLAPGARANHNRRRRFAGDDGARHRPAEHRRSSGDQQLLRRPKPPTKLRPRRDRRVPVHLEPVRRDAGTLVGGAGERHYQVGHQRADGHGLGPTSATQRMNAEDFIQHRVMPLLESTGQHIDRRSNPPRQDALLLQLRVRARAIHGDTQHAVPEFQRRSDVGAPAAQADGACRLAAVSKMRLRSRGMSGETSRPIARLPFRAQRPPSAARRITPTNQLSFNKYAEAIQGTLTRVINNRTMNELKVGYAREPPGCQDTNIKWHATTGLRRARSPVAMSGS